jgi:hypothetical protein
MIKSATPSLEGEALYASILVRLPGYDEELVRTIIQKSKESSLELGASLDFRSFIISVVIYEIGKGGPIPAKSLEQIVVGVSNVIPLGL